MCERMWVFAFVSGRCTYLWAEKQGKWEKNKKNKKNSVGGERDGLLYVWYCSFSTYEPHSVLATSSSVSVSAFKGRCGRKAPITWARGRMMTEVTLHIIFWNKFVPKGDRLNNSTNVYFPLQSPEFCGELIRIVSSYLPPRWPAAVSEW